MIFIKKVISLFLVLLTVLSVFPISTFALNWDGDSAGGSTNAVNGNNSGYVIRSTTDSKCVVGYRFSAMDSSGGMKVTKVIDVYRDTANGDLAYSSSAKFSKKYNKKQVYNNRDAELSTTSNTTNCYKEEDMDFVTVMPNPSGVETWQSYETNINKVLSKLGVGSVANMAYGDKVIIEPLFDICLAGEYQALTVSEIAYCGRSVLGGTSKGGTSNGTSSTWGFIANYTNRIWPNKLFTPDGQGLWTAASEIASDSKVTFNTLLSKGYGAGIAYNETTNKTYKIKFNGNGSTGGSMSVLNMQYNVAKKLTANAFTKTGHYFDEWNKKADGSSTSYSNQQSVKNLTSTHDATVNLYAQWKPYKLKVYFNANGGSISSDTYYLSSNNIYKVSDSTRHYQSWTYNNTKSDGLVNASTFGLYKTGYRFNIWGTSTSGGTLYDQNDTTIKPTDLNSGISSGDCTKTLYAQWTPNTYTIKFNGNGSTSGSTAQMSMTYDVTKNLTANGFVKSGYHFSGWNTKADGSGTSYYNSQAVKNLTSTHGATINLYAQWSTNSYTIAFNGNGNTGGNTSSMTMNFDVAKNLNANGYTRTGYTFSKWNSTINGTGTNYTDKQSVKNLTTVNGGTFYLYAQWTPNTYTIKFNGNGSTSGSTAQMSMTYDVAKSLTANGFNKTGYLFNGWNSNTSGTGTNYSDKQSVKNLTSTNGATVNLYAKWTPITYTVRFDGNGATSGSTASMSMTYDSAKNLTANGYNRTYYKFIGWNTKADGSGTSYSNQQSVKNLTTTNGAIITLYAQWRYDPMLDVNECDVYSGNKSDKTTLFGITKGNVFDDYVYKTDYPTVGDIVWYNIHFPAESKSITVRQYVKYSGGSWQTRDVTLSSTSASSQWFPVQFDGNYKTVPESISYYEIEAKTDWIDSSGNVLKSGAIKTFYIPIKPLVHRYKVEARGYEKTITAYNGMTGLKGTLYSGQRVNLSYVYKGGTSWYPVEYIRGSLYYYNGSKWVTAYKDNEGFDVAKNKVYINNSGVFPFSSMLNPYTVPLTSQNKLRFKLTTWWMNDKEHTEESSWIELPVAPCDLQLREIKLYDKNAYKWVDPQKLEAGQEIRVQYIYYNNTDAKVFVESYDDDREIIGNAVYAIPAKSSAGMWGKEFTVPNKRTFTIWGGVYQEGMGIGGTEYETNGENNELTLTCKVKHPLNLVPIPQNADYREGTEVVTSFWLKNKYTDDYTPSDNISVKFNVYRDSSLIKSVTKNNVIIPGLENNLIYFKWIVPTGLNSEDVRITGEIIEAGNSYNKVTDYYFTTPRVISVTPDTQFEKKPPTGFSVPLTLTSQSQSASWWEWTYSSGNFMKKTYAIGYSTSTALMVPETGNTANKVGSTWYMRSGYGVSFALSNSIREIGGYYAPSSAAYTKSQYAVALFPEFGYSTNNGKCKTLLLNSDLWTFRENENYGKVHFTPLWYPNGDYIVTVVQSDMWTPAGMIKRVQNTNKIKITDSAYDDWHVGN